MEDSKMYSQSIMANETLITSIVSQLEDSIDKTAFESYLSHFDQKYFFHYEDSTNIMHHKTIKYIRQFHHYIKKYNQSQFSLVCRKVIVSLIRCFGIQWAASKSNK